MALMKEGLWGIVTGTEVVPGEVGAGYDKFVSRRDKALAIVVLSVDPTLLYLIGEPTISKLYGPSMLISFKGRRGQIGLRCEGNCIQ